jgi:hypothetical protein
MKNIFKHLILVFILFYSCSKKVEKPVVSIQEYSKQLVVMNGVVNKILNEPDPKRMFIMADSIESARAVSCIPIAEECNLYYKIINKIVNFTREGKLTADQKMELFKMRNEFQEEIKADELKIRAIWKEYILSLGKSETPENKSAQ